MKWIGTGILVVLALLNWASPYLMRRDLLFGVTVSPEFRNTAGARRIIRQYQKVVLLFGIASIIMGLLMPHHDTWNIRWMFPIVLLALGCCAGFAQAHSASLPHAARPSGIREVDLLPRPHSRVESLWMLFAGPALVAVGFTFVFSIPDQSGRIPLLAGWNALVARWDAIDAVVDKPLSFMLGACLGSLFPLLAFRFGTRRTPSGMTNYRRVMLRNIILFNVAFAAFAVWVMSSGAFGRAVDTINFRVALTVIGAGLAAHLAYVLVLRRRENLQMLSAAGHPLGDRTPDELWLWGIFYHNPDDPALFVEARSGPGYTMNFGHLGTWLLAAGFIAVMLLPLIVK